jgi:hypothetical protein
VAPDQIELGRGGSLGAFRVAGIDVSEKFALERSWITRH